MSCSSCVNEPEQHLKCLRLEQAFWAIMQKSNLFFRASTKRRKAKLSIVVQIQSKHTCPYSFYTVVCVVGISSAANRTTSSLPLHEVPSERSACGMLLCSYTSGCVWCHFLSRSATDPLLLCTERGSPAFEACNGRQPQPGR